MLEGSLASTVADSQRIAERRFDVSSCRPSCNGRHDRGIRDASEHERAAAKDDAAAETAHRLSARPAGTIDGRKDDPAAPQILDGLSEDACASIAVREVPVRQGQRRHVPAMQRRADAKLRAHVPRDEDDAALPAFEQRQHVGGRVAGQARQSGHSPLPDDGERRVVHEPQRRAPLRNI